MSVMKLVQSTCFWVAPVFGRDTSRVLAYAHDVANINLALTYGEIVHEVLRVQAANVAANHITRDLLLSDEATDHPKVNRLREVAKTMAYSKIFLSSAAQTQLEMAGWDRLGAW